MKRLKILFIATALTVTVIPVVLAADEHKHEGYDNSHVHDKADKKQDSHNHGEKHERHAHEGHESYQNQGNNPDTDEPHHGGIVGVANDYHHELVIGDEGKLSLYVEGLPKAVEALKLVTVRLMVLQGKEKKELDMTLAEDDQHRFEGIMTTSLVANDKVVALIVLNDKDTRIVRFEIPVKK